MKRDLAIMSLLWLALTVAGEYLATQVDIYPAVMSDKGEEITDAFRLLVVMAVPVFTMVIAVLVVSFIFHRARGEPQEDGPPIQGRGPFPVAWFAVTAALTLTVMIYPGLTSLAKVLDDPAPDLVVKVDGLQWTWSLTYPDLNVTGVRELVLPVDRTVRFEITSRDVLHSFWIPAFLMKIDAVPGRTTVVTLKPTETGSYQEDSTLRLQCAELCGLSHSRMSVPVRVVTQAEFDSWVQENARAPQPTGTPAGPVVEFALVAYNLLFDVTEMNVPAGSTVKLTVDNQDKGVSHNWALYESEEAAKSGEAPIVGTPLEVGPIKQELTFEAPDPGAYFFRCDAHPATMKGTLTVE